MSTLKAKIYRVRVGGNTHFVYGTSRASAMKNFVEHLSAVDDSVRLATGEELFNHGRAADSTIIAEDKYRRVVDPAQAGLPVTVEPTA